MKICLACGQRFDSEIFCCPLCGYSPEMCKGYPAFAPGVMDSYNGFAAEFYHRLAELEKGNFWFESRNSLLIWILHHFFPHMESFLEIGCGTGFVLSGIQENIPGLKLSGSDVFSEGLVYAEQRVPAADFFQMDAKNIPFEEEFDVIGAFDVLEHIEEDEAVLFSVFRALKSGGGIILTVPQHKWLWSEADEIACHKRRYSKMDLGKKMKKAGFREVYMTSFLSFLLPVMAASRLTLGRFVRKGKKGREGDLRQPPLINRLLKMVCDFERSLIKGGVTFSVGGSLLYVGMKG